VPKGGVSRTALIGAGAAAVAVVIAATLVGRHPSSSTAATPAARMTTAPAAAPATPTAPTQSATPSSYRATVAVEPSNAVIDFDGEPAGTGIASREFARDGREHSVTMRAAGFQIRTISFRDAPPPSPIRLELETAVAMQPPSAAPPMAHVGERPHHPGAASHAANAASAGAHAAPPAVATPAPPASVPAPASESHAQGTANVGTNGAAIIAP
jgi:hypothetical protein